MTHFEKVTRVTLCYKWIPTVFAYAQQWKYAGAYCNPMCSVLKVVLNVRSQCLALKQNF